MKIPNNFQVAISSDLREPGAAYLKRTGDDVDGIKTYLFMLVSEIVPNCLSVGINSSDPNAEGGSSAFKISPLFESDLKPDAKLIAVADPGAKKFSLRIWREVRGRKIGDAKTVLPIEDDQKSQACVVGQDSKLTDWLISSAWAQSGLSMNELSNRLKSDDLFTRRDARIDLSKQPNSVTMAQEFLASGNYRLELGALVALSIMPEADRKKLPPDLLNKIRAYKTNKDITISETAARIEVPPR